MNTFSSPPTWGALVTLSSWVPSFASSSPPVPASSPFFPAAASPPPDQIPDYLTYLCSLISSKLLKFRRGRSDLGIRWPWMIWLHGYLKHEVLYHCKIKRMLLDKEYKKETKHVQRQSYCCVLFTSVSSGLATVAEMWGNPCILTKEMN